MFKWDPLLKILKQQYSTICADNYDSSILKRAEEIGFSVQPTKSDVAIVHNIENLFNLNNMTQHVLLLDCIKSPEQRLVAHTELTRLFDKSYYTGKFIENNVPHHYYIAFKSTIPFHYLQLVKNAMTNQSSASTNVGIRGLKDRIHQRLKSIELTQKNRIYRTDMAWMHPTWLETQKTATDVNQSKKELLIYDNSKIQQVVMEDPETKHVLTKLIPLSTPRVSRHSHALSFSQPADKLNHQCETYVNKMMYLEEIQVGQNKRMHKRNLSFEPVEIQE